MLQTAKALEFENLEKLAKGSKSNENKAIKPHKWAPFWEKKMLHKLRKKMGLDQTKVFVSGAVLLLVEQSVSVRVSQDESSGLRQ